MPKPCSDCGSLNHSRFLCPHKPRKPLKTTTTLKPRKAMNKVGRVGKATNAAVAKWKRTQKPTHEGYYECIYCGAWVVYLMAEHTKSRARNPKLRTETSLLKPTCDPCNEAKGSLNDDEYLAKLQKEKEAQDANETRNSIPNRAAS